MKKIYSASIVFVLLLGVTSCSSTTYDEISEETPGAGGGTTVTYAVDVKPIIDANCVSCHAPGKSVPYAPLTTYSEVVSAVQNTNLLSRIQKQNGENGLMPQTGRMPQTKIDVILQWVADGTPE